LEHAVFDSSKLSPHFVMASNPRKRKVVTRPAPVESESEDELADGLLDGILSHSEDDSDDGQDEYASGASSEIEGLSDEDEADEEGGSDTDLGSDEDDIREQFRNLKTTDNSAGRSAADLSLDHELDSRTNGGLDEDDDDDSL
jgi:ribosome biogenesis protein ERB1